MEIFQYFVSAPYRIGLDIVPILLIANLFLGLYYNVATWYKLADKTRFGAYIAVIGAIITIIGNLLLIPIMGYVGAAWATLACYVTMVVVCYLWGQKHYPIPYPVFKILFYIAAALIVYALYSMVYPFIQPLTIVSFSVSFLFLGLYLGGIWKIEGNHLKQIIKR
jgi:O-antigen/teichoic acid export membrane protein